MAGAVDTTGWRFRRALKTVLIYSALGPPIGMFGLLLVIAVVSALEDGSYGHVLLVPLIVVSPFILFAYIFGGVAALLTGTAMAVIEWWRRASWPRSFRTGAFWGGVAVATIIGAATSLLVQIFAFGFNFQATNTLDDLPVLPFSGGVAAAICHALSVRWFDAWSSAEEVDGA